ncbi:hypothetical protein Skr01_74280 [Sphaerisporangium krabiense]|uniref:Uncharacterized protein n=1 Tax=Sphaerisporangium krabiense TaxID=763782 RepID=A0A7W9DPU5_9ACTN|nr:hypothetical protein [Sphaerisporangium krabiense]MBB5626857.1 hypothetical protein [Sphaerisporangium krabiense]GII67343.1 hypothetical protein Skr01_74280 [Sphaerisporangium krabiense]
MNDTPSALRALRERFPHWAFLYNPFAYRWYALHGRTTTLTADTPQELAERIVRHQVRQRLTRPQPRQ